MDGKGWKPEYGISEQGIRLLGFLEALPRDEREGIADAVEEFCRAQGYLSLHDDLGSTAQEEERRPHLVRPSAKVIPFRRGR